MNIKLLFNERLVLCLEQQPAAVDWRYAYWFRPLHALTMTASEIKSSVPLQICLYFHDFYVYLAFLVTILLYIVKSTCCTASAEMHEHSLRVQA